MSFLRIKHLFFLIPLLLTHLLIAQVTASTGSIRGLVIDPSGSVVANAVVKLTNSSLALEKETKSQSDGTFVFPLLQPASGYEVSVTAPGYERQVSTNIAVRVTETTVLNISLKIGSVAQQVTVSGGEAQVNTTNATLGEVVGTRVITSVPLPTRNVFDLAATDAGVYENLDSPASTIAQGGNAVYVAGQRATNNDYRLNGVESTSVEFHSLAAGAIPIPDPDAIQEFRTQTSLYDATTAYGSGGNISLITRAGTNAYHGVAYDFLRNTIFNANDYFLKYAQEHPAVGNPTNTPPVMLQNQFGGSFGGPVPKLRDTFFFFNYEGLRQKNGSTGTVSGEVPVLPANRTAAALAAAFSLPVASIDPVAVRLLNAPGPAGGYLFPSVSGTPGTLGLYAASGSVILNTDQTSSRVDHDFKIGAQDNHVAAAFFYQHGIFINPSGLSGSPGQAYDYPLGNQNLSLIDTHTFNARVVNEAVYGYNWVQRDIEAYGQGVLLATVGMNRFNSGYFPYLPSFSFGTDGSLGEFGYGGNIGRYQHTSNVDFHDTVLWSLGKHSLRFGFETIREVFNETPQASPGGSLTFDNDFANAIYGTPANSAQNLDIRDFLIGAPIIASDNTGVQRFHIRAADYAAFLQDDYRVIRQLTLNLGLRYDHMGNPRETNNYLSNFDPSLLSAATLQNGGAGLEAGFVQANVNGASASTLKTNNGSFSPRVGFAYDVFGNAKLAIHGGFGLYYQSADDEQSQLINNPPFYLSATQTQTSFTAANVTGLTNPFSGNLDLPQPSAFPLFPTFQTLSGVNPNTGAPIYSSGTPVSLNGVRRDNKSPYAESYNLTGEYAFPHNWTLAIGYLGTKGVRQSAGLSLNNALFVNAANPGRYGLTANSSANREARVPIAGVSSTGFTTIVNEAYSTYNALLVTVTHQYTRSFLVKAAYTRSKSVDNFPASASTGYGGSSQIGNQYDLSLNTGTSEQDVPNRFVATYVWDLPGVRNRVANYFLGHWSLSGISTYQNGLASAVTQSVTSTSLTGTSGYGVITGQLKKSGSPQKNFKAGIIQYLNPSSASQQTLLTNGSSFGPTSPYGAPGSQYYTVGPGTSASSASASGRLIGAETRGAVRAPFQERWDMALARNFPVSAFGDKGNLEFRAEAFKLFNNAIFSGPNSTAGSASFGQITSTIDTTGRQLQFALKLSF